jgi:ribosomal protein S18 acetylase RimI-like enzyme
MSITYKITTDGITPDRLNGFFVGWEKVPSPEVLLRILNGSDHVVLAQDSEVVVGFIAGNTDGVISAYIPLIEVLPAYQKQGIGRELLTRMLRNFEHIYMVDLMCDEDVEGFYEKFGFIKTSAMMLRHYDKQNCT